MIVVRAAPEIAPTASESISIVQNYHHVEGFSELWKSIFRIEKKM
jgi:hypothetical protein